MIYTIWYRKSPTFIPDPHLTINNLRDTHVHVRTIKAESLDEVYHKSQGEIWSPNGEARLLIQSLGLLHTSMSVGDVIQQGNNYWEVWPNGFRQLLWGSKEDRSI